MLDKEEAPQVRQTPRSPAHKDLEVTVDTTRVHHHDDTLDAHYSGLERLRPHGCYRGLVFIGHLVEEDGEEVEVFESVPCRRCSDKA
ncbi:MAG: hypothetical protein WKF53_15090 [Rubrobacter sp.]